MEMLDREELYQFSVHFWIKTMEIYMKPKQLSRFKSWIFAIFFSNIESKKKKQITLEKTS